MLYVAPGLIIKGIVAFWRDDITSELFIQHVKRNEKESLVIVPG